MKTAIYRTVKVLCSYLPGKVSPITIHNLPGINVELSKSSMNYVTLSPLSLDSTGRYRCEVSEEVSSSHPHTSHVTSHCLGPHVRHGQRLRRSVGCGGARRRSQVGGSKEQVS